MDESLIYVNVDIVCYDNYVAIATINRSKLSSVARGWYATLDERAMDDLIERLQVARKEVWG